MSNTLRICSTFWRPRRCLISELQFTSADLQLDQDSSKKICWLKRSGEGSAHAQHMPGGNRPCKNISVQSYKCNKFEHYENKMNEVKTSYNEDRGGNRQGVNILKKKNLLHPAIIQMYQQRHIYLHDTVTKSCPHTKLTINNG